MIMILAFFVFIKIALMTVMKTQMSGVLNLGAIDKKNNQKMMSENDFLTSLKMEVSVPPVPAALQAPNKHTEI